MSEEPASSTSSPFAKPDTHWLGWMLGLVAVPLVYVLALPPVGFLATKYSMTGRSPDPPPIVMLIGKPYDWLAESTPLKRPLYAYVDWWSMQIFGIDTTTRMPAPPPAPPTKAP